MVPLSWRGDVILGLAAMVVLGVGSQWVGPWSDETATAHFVSYPTWDMVQLWKGTGNYPQGVDLVLAPYYLFMHQWVRVVGINIVSLRLPSVIAAGIAVMAIAGVGRRVSNRRGQLTYATCAALLPRTTAMAIEARPYMLSAMFVAVALLMVVQIHQSSRWWRWLGLGVALSAAMFMHLFAAVPLAALVVVSWAVTPGIRRWGVAAVGALSVLVVTPWALASLKQVSQTDAAAIPITSLAERLLVESWATTRTTDAAALIPSEIPPHTVALISAILAGVFLVLVVFSRRARMAPRFWYVFSVLAATMVIFIAVDSLDLLNLSSRYLTPAAPLFSVLLAETFLHARGKWNYLLVTTLVVGCLVMAASQRRLYAKGPNTDQLLVGDVLDKYSVLGEGFLIDPGYGWVNPYRSAIDVSPAAFEGLVDIGRPIREPLVAPWPSDSGVTDLAAGKTCLRPSGWLPTADRCRRMPPNLKRWVIGQACRNPGRHWGT